MRRGFVGRSAGVAILAAALVHAAESLPEPPLDFVRVMVPADRVRDVPLAPGRLVPMPLVEFDRAVASLVPAEAARNPRPFAFAARYSLALDDRGWLAGALEFDLDPATVILANAVPLGRVRVERAVRRGDGGVGEAVVFGLPDGGVAVQTATPGTYACDIAIPPDAASALRMPLVASLTTSIEIRLPAGLRPELLRRGGGIAMQPPSVSGNDHWRVDLAGEDPVDVAIVPIEGAPTPVRAWSRVGVRGRQVDVTTRLVPAAAWQAGMLVLAKDPRLAPVRAWCGPTAIEIVRDDDAARARLVIPAAIVGTVAPIDLSGVAEAAIDRAFPVPTVRPRPDEWAGGGLTLVVDPNFAVAALELDEYVVAPPAAGERWPTAVPVTDRQGDAAVVHLEQASAAARATVTITARVPRLDTVRVTTLELSPGAVLGRASCDVRVDSGEAFVITGRIAPEWFIDSVEAFDSGRAGSAATPDEQRSTPAAAGRAIDWRVLRAADQSELRIGLAEAATPVRPLGLRITGHRRGVPLGGEFLPGDLDMVRLAGENAESSLVEYRVGPDAVIELGDEPMGMLPTDGRFAPLVEPGAARGRIHGGDRHGGESARLVRRRPPVEADVAVQMVARDSRITESLTFDCRPAAGAIDSVMVSVSEPLGDTVDWTLAEPSVGALFARRMEVVGEGDDRAASGHESWLVEFRPAVEGPVRFRATRTRPFTGPVAAPIAWVDGATDAHGTLVIRGAGGSRPVVVNQGLAERPVAIQDDRSAAVVTELSYPATAARATRPGDPPPVIVVPPTAASARAWVWRESTTAWCHDSGWIECESEFDIENRGRGELKLTVPAGLRLDGVLIDGEAAAFDGLPESGGTTRVLLPTGRGRVRLKVHGVASRAAALGIWRIDPVACAVDVPVLDRTLRVMMPADLDLVAAGRTEPGADDWFERLLDATPFRSGGRFSEPGEGVAGFRVVDLPAAEAADAGGIHVVRRRLMSSASIVTAVVAATAACGFMRLRPRVAVTLVAGLALAALWVPHPFVPVARAAWWGGLLGLGYGSAAWGRRRGAAAMLVGLGAVLAADGAAAPAAEADGPVHRVYITPAEGGGTALVPEPLFRRLTAASPGRESVRVMASRLLITPEGPWRLELDIDGDQGGVLALDQTGADVRWQRPDGDAAGSVAVELLPDGLRARVAIATAGFHRVTLGLMPRPIVAGDLERVIVRLPPAGRSQIVATSEPGGNAPGDAACWHVDCGDAGTAWGPVTDVQGVCDVSLATRVRLCRATDPRQPVAPVPEHAESLNELWWGEDACVVNASFEIDCGRSLVPSFVIRADPPLEPVAEEASHPLVPLGGGRYRVDRAEPTPGRMRLSATFAMAFDDPTGSFDVPRVWLEGVTADVRTVRCSTAAGLEVTPELPPGFSLLRPRDGDASPAAAVWRSEHVHASDPTPAVAGGDRRVPGVADAPRPRVGVRRRVTPARILQRLDVTFSADDVDLAFEGRIDARSSPFTGVTLEVPAEASIDRVAVVDEGGNAEPVDVHVSRPEPARLRIVVQRPHPGGYRLSIAAHLSGPPAKEGRMPMLRCLTPAMPPLGLRWRSRGGVDISVQGPLAGVSEGQESWEVSADDPGPTYLAEPAAERLVRDPAAGASSPRAALPADQSLGHAVEAATVHLALDEGGRLWGVARFDLATDEPAVKLRLGAGQRLFDALVDGRETQATPAEGGGWEVRLHDVGWPRSILAVFAGQAGAVASGGSPIRIEPPSIEGLPCREVLWTIDMPAGMGVRVAEPAHVVGAIAWKEARAAVRRRMAGFFATAIDGASEADRDRLRAFAAAREEGRSPPLESEWERALQGPADAGRTRLHVLGAGPDGLTLRTIRSIAIGGDGRGEATAVLVAMIIAGWLLAAWHPAVWGSWAVRFWPWAIALAGVVWVMLLRPTLPGWALVAAALAVLVGRRQGGAAAPGHAATQQT